MKMAPRRLKINNLQSDLMQTPFSCKVERQRRMKSYRHVGIARFPHSVNPVYQALDSTICLHSWVKRNKRSREKRTPEDHTNDYCQPSELGNGTPHSRGTAHFSFRQEISDGR